MFRNTAIRALIVVTVWSCAGPAFGQPPITDPTLPPQDTVAGPVAASGPALLLYSTQVSADSRSAVINSEVVTVGSNVGGALVTSIERGRVTLRRGTEITELRLMSAPMKQLSRKTP